MRRLPLLACCCATVLSTSACLRDGGPALPDRRGHAYVHGIDANATVPAGRASAPRGGGTAGAGEELVVVEPGQRLWQIAEQRQVSMRWIIERNGLEQPVRPGDSIVVPAR